MCRTAHLRHTGGAVSSSESLMRTAEEIPSKGSPNEDVDVCIGVKGVGDLAPHKMKNEMN
jgi:hypothetical protein